jgi:hypothetical protein
MSNKIDRTLFGESWSNRKILAVPDAVVGGGERGAGFAVKLFQRFEAGGESFAQNAGKFSVFKVGGWVGGVGDPLEDFAGDAHDDALRQGGMAFAFHPGGAAQRIANRGRCIYRINC